MKVVYGVPSFTLYGNGKVVVCDMYACIDNNENDGRCLNRMIECTNTFVRVRGKAKCHDNDSFDVETGKKIAYVRAKAKALKHFDRIFIEMKKEMRKSMNSLHDAMFTVEKTYGNEIVYLETLSK